MTCQRCDVKPAVDGERFCKGCRNTKIREMESSGYLQRPERKRVSDEIGRRQLSMPTRGGSAEMNNDGDD